MYHCVLCKSFYTRKSNLDRHYQMHRGVRFPCPMCPSLLTYKTNLARHMRNVHGVAPAPRHRGLDDIYEFKDEDTSPAAVPYHSYRRTRKQTSPNNNNLQQQSLLRQQFRDDDTSDDKNIKMSLDNGQSAVSSPRSSMAKDVKPKMEHLDDRDVMIKQEIPDEQEEYVRPSVIVWNPTYAMGRTTFETSRQDSGVANLNGGSYFRPV